MATPALKFALDQGFRIFPVHGKKPAIRAYPQLASNDPTVVEKWAGRFPSCNWAVLTGAASDDLVVDVDGPAGLESLAAIEAKHSKLPATLSVRTGRDGGGRQLHYRWPAGRDLHSSAGKIAPAIDIRAWHSLAIIPDSIHPTTLRRYEWENSGDRATLPEWFVHLIEQQWIQTHAPRNVVRGRDNVDPGVSIEPCGGPRRHGFRALLPGDRTNGLLRVAGKLQRKGVPFEHIKDVLIAENLRRCRPPLPADKVIKIAKDIARYSPAFGPDPLDLAWSRLDLCDAASTSHKFRALARELQHSRPDSPIVLPQARVAALLGVSQQLVSRLCRTLLADGFLRKVDHYIAKESAQTFFVQSRGNTLFRP
jgi:putative DNA primase/helicase